MAALWAGTIASAAPSSGSGFVVTAIRPFGEDPLRGWRHSLGVYHSVVSGGAKVVKNRRFENPAVAVRKSGRAVPLTG